jgi:nucleoside-diphosphate-sugar epimerase
MKVSIIGCGWLGLPLSQYLIAKGVNVKGSTTTPSKLNILRSLGIKPYLISLHPGLKSSDIIDFLDSEILIINIPPSLKTRPSEFHVEQIKTLLANIPGSAVTKIIYISSTSIYPDLNKEVKEDNVQTITEAANKTLALAEHLIRNNKATEFLVLRCAGLTGYDRILVKHFSGKTGLPDGKKPVNLIHRDDVVSLIFHLLSTSLWNQTYNICSPHHPERQRFYTELALKFQYQVPQFDPYHQGTYKIVNSDRITTDLKYKFIYPDPLNFEYTEM